MGFAARKPRLPQATESSIGEGNNNSNNEEVNFSEEYGTDLSVRTDKTHYSVPEDGSPITIRTNKKASKLDRISTTNQGSQTSLLIEYFESGKGDDPEQRPSVRVKVIPSSRKSKGKSEGQLRLTKPTGTRAARKLSLVTNSPRIAVHDDVSVPDSDRAVLAEHRAQGVPISTEFQSDKEISTTSASPELHYIPTSSDISSMPTDSVLAIPQSPQFQRKRPTFNVSEISSIPAEEVDMSNFALYDSTNLQPPMFPRERNSSSERLAAMAAAKVKQRSRDNEQVQYGEDLGNSVHTFNREVTVGAAGPRPRPLTGKNLKDIDSYSGTASSVLSIESGSARNAKTFDQNPSQSVLSQDSIQNNPKLLKTVEDAIRRLILPELRDMRKEQKQQSSHSKYDKSFSEGSENSIAREKSAHRSSAHTRARPHSSRERTERSNSGGRRRRSSQQDYDDYDSLSDASSRQRGSEFKTGERRSSRERRSRRHKDFGFSEDLTAAALRAKEQVDNAGSRRRRRSSKGRSSRSNSIANSEEGYPKRQIPPMPMQSDLGTDVTRSSILSSNTTGSRTPVQQQAQYSGHNDPQNIPRSTSSTPTRPTGNARNVLGMHHGNFSERNLSSTKLAYEIDPDVEPNAVPHAARDLSTEDYEIADPATWSYYERNIHKTHPIKRGLSPIQSVASYQTTEPNRHSMKHGRSIDSMASTKKRQQQLREEVSLGSITSPSPDFKKQRPRGVNLENRSEIMSPHAEADEDSLRFDRPKHLQHRISDAEPYRDSYATTEPNRGSYMTDETGIDRQRFSSITDDSSEVHLNEKPPAGRQVETKIGLVPEYKDLPSNIEASAVASLVEPSLLSMPGSQISFPSASTPRDRSGSSLPRESQTLLHEDKSYKSSPLAGKRDLGRSYESATTTTPLGGQFQSSQDDRVYPTRDQDTSILPLPKSPLSRQYPPTEEQSPESDFVTNPSIIQGPIAGYRAGRDTWMSTDTRDFNRSRSDDLNREYGSEALDLVPQGLNVNQRQTIDDPKPNTYIIGQGMSGSPGFRHDEGYATGNSPSPGPTTKLATDREYRPSNNGLAMSKLEDPFASTNVNHLSGMSQGMPPFYDAATGKGIERIQSDDIVALMNHLTVRDAQRNARDTEIIETLVRSAVDMRNSFDEIKAFIAENNEMNMTSSNQQHAQTQQVVVNTRPLPTMTRGVRTPSSQDDLPTKRKNVFKRALQGLGSKNTVELQNIESMLMQLLDEVEALRAGQASTPLVNQLRNGSNASEARPGTDTGYEPEGRAGTSSTGLNQSGFLSIDSSRQGHQNATRNLAGNRVSTVMEGEEDSQEQTPMQYSQRPNDQARFDSPYGVQNDYQHHSRGISEPLQTPPGMYKREFSNSSSENTPKTKSVLSSILPKPHVFGPSRWSESTKSSAGYTYRTSAQSRPRPYSQSSNPEFASHDYDTQEHADDGRLQSSTSLQEGNQYRNQENRPPSPLVPSAVSDNPKYQAHRDSGMMEHPRPQHGPTGKYQFHLENAAKTYQNGENSYVSPQSTSTQWETNNRGSFLPQTSAQPHYSQTYQQTMSPISDRSSFVSGTGARIPGEEPLVPRRQAKIANPMSPSTYVDEVKAARAGSPALDKSPINALRSPAGPGRKPSGPRPLSSNSLKREK